MQSTQQSQNYVFKKLMLISRCNEDFENQFALLFSVVDDLNALFDFTTRGLGWIVLLEDVIKSLHLEQQIVARFQHNLIHFTTLDTIKLVVLPSINLNVERRTLLHGIRGLVIAWHLDHDVKIPLNLLTSLEILFKAKSKDVQILIQNLDLDLKNLQDYQSQLGTTNKWFKFLSNLIIALQASDIGPSIKHRSNKSTSFNASQLFIKNNKTDPLSNFQKISEHKQDSIETKISGDLFNYNRVELDHLYRKEFSGVPNLFKHYHPYELSQFVPALVKEFQQNNDEIILAFFLCLFLRCHVSRFDLVALNKSAGKNLFLDIEQGFLVWNRQALIKSHNEFEEIKIPLPVEIAIALKEKHSKRPDALALGDLFDAGLPSLKKQVRKFTFTNAISSHRAFVTRLHFAYGRFVLFFCKDEVYAAAISVDFSLAVTANFNYFLLQPDRLNSICKTVYKELGFSSEFLIPVIKEVGSAQGQQVEQLVNLMNKQLDECKKSVLTIHNRSTMDDLITTHNKIILGISLIFAVTSGLRKARQYSICNHTLCLKNGLALINDKISTRYLSCRVVPIPEITKLWLIFYKHWLSSLAARMANKNKKFSTDISTICQTECSFGNIPFFFYFHRGVIKGIGSKHLQLVLNKNLEGNVGRHFLDRMLRNEIGSVLLNAHAGRANLGQEPFGMRSALSVSDATQKLKTEIDKALHGFNISMPPFFKPVRYQPYKVSRIYYPSSWQKSTHKFSEFGEDCPFNQFSLFNAIKFERVIKYWLSVPLKHEVGQLAVSLVLMDGVIHPEEIIYAVKELTHGRILKIENDYFVDVDTPLLGIRRINLSYTTLSLLNVINLFHEFLQESDLYKAINDSVGQVLVDAGIDNDPSLLKLTRIAEDFYTLNLPGMLREWMCGRQHARTLRPEALWRHRYKLKERLSDLGNEKHRTIKSRSNRALIDELTKACDQSDGRKSNALRMKNLAIVLEALVGSFSSLSDNILAQYTKFLSADCPKIKSPSTVLSHFYKIKPLVQDVCTGLEDIDELTNIDWLQVTTEFMGNIVDDHGISAVNYLLLMLNQPQIKSLKKDEARSSRNYLDYPSTIEIDNAIEMIFENPNLNPYQKLSGLVLKLITHVPLRAEDVIHLRLSDIFIGEQSFIVISSEATGTKKSENANRVLFLTDPNLVRQLKDLINIRQSISPKSTYNTALFGNVGQPNSFEGADEILSIVSDVLRCVTGSAFVRPHTLRAKYLTENYSLALLPQEHQLNALKQRNILYELAANAGHADPDVGVKNYVCDLNKIRRIWVNKLILKKVQFSPDFLSSITFLNLSAARKRLQRNFLEDDLVNIIKNKLVQKLNRRIHDLHLLNHVEDLQYELETKTNLVDNLIQTSQVLACVFLGMSKEAAATYAVAENSLTQKIYLNLETFAGHKGGQFETSIKADYGRFKAADTFIKLAQHFRTLVLKPAQCAQLLKLIPLRLERPFLGNESDIAFMLDFLLPGLKQAGFIFTVYISKSDSNSTNNSEKTNQLNRLGVRRVDEVSRRLFDSRDQLMFAFSPQGSSNQKINNFEINIFMISLLIQFS